jgi:muramoyltetrapeptide carboxypeptidase
MQLEALNELAEKNDEIESTITGGNLCVLMTSLATNWQIDTKNKILMIEDVNEEPYRIDRMLNQLFQAGLLNIKALLLGDFTQPEKKRSEAEMQAVLQSWVKRLNVPALKVKLGHARENHPLPLGLKARLKLGKQPNINFMF